MKTLSVGISSLIVFVDLGAPAFAQDPTPEFPSAFGAHTVTSTSDPKLDNHRDEVT